METTLTDAPPIVEKQLNLFERCLTVWVALCKDLSIRNGPFTSFS
jgi:hypothetical protein